MARIAIIGGSGHVGTYLAPALVERGHKVVNVSRGVAKPYRPHNAWNQIENVTLDRATEEKSGRFGQKIAGLKPDIVVDMISFDLPSTQQLVEALRGKVEHYLFCSSIWVVWPLLRGPIDRSGPAESYRYLRPGQGGKRSVASEAGTTDRFPGNLLPPGPYRRRGMGTYQSDRQCRPRNLFADRSWR